MSRIAAFVILAAIASGAAAAQDSVVNVSTEDAAVNRAIRDGRATLPAILAQMADPPAGTSAYSLKVAVPKPGGGDEHIWMTDCTGLPDAIACLLANEPMYVDLDPAARHAVPTDAISDWSYEAGGKIHGNYTARVLVERLPAEEAAALKARFAPLPRS